MIFVISPNFSAKSQSEIFVPLFKTIRSCDFAPNFSDMKYTMIHSEKKPLTIAMMITAFFFDIEKLAAFWYHCRSGFFKRENVDNTFFLHYQMHFRGFSILVLWTNYLYVKVGLLETVQDFLIKLGIKPRMHILEISIFSLNHVIVRPTKIMNNLLKDCKIRTFKVIFQHQKSTKFFCEEY